MTYRNDILRLEEANLKYLGHLLADRKELREKTPLIVTAGNDCFIKDTYGKWYLDGISSLGTNVHGHGRPEIDAAITVQLGRIAQSASMGLSHVPAIQLAESLIKLTDMSLS